MHFILCWSSFRINHSTNLCLSFLNDKILKVFDNGLLTHFIPLVSFCTLWKHHKNSGFPDVFRGYRKRLVVWNELIGMISVDLQKEFDTIEDKYAFWKIQSNWVVVKILSLGLIQIWLIEPSQWLGIINSFMTDVPTISKLIHWFASRSFSLIKLQAWRLGNLLKRDSNN